jgi:peptide/nickel transport system substrate-binding protein
MRSMSRRRAAILGGVAVLAMVAAACGSSKTLNTTGGASGIIPASVNTYSPTLSGKITGGTVYWAQAPQGAPNYIFPLVSGSTCGTNNVEYLSAMLYRPLYWFGNDNSPTVDYDYSIGKAPVWNSADTSVTINLNNWKWSDGESVTANDVAFYLSLAKVNPAADDCYYVPPIDGEKFFPDNVTSFTVNSPTSITFNLSQAYNPTWFLYNELSQITPFPMAWDATSMSEVGMNDTASGTLSSSRATAVYNFLNAQSTDTGTWASSKIWQIVDGPFKLSSFTSTGQVTLVPNADYSGTPKPSISQFVEIPYTDNNAELTALLTGGTSSVTVGYLPPEDVSELSTLESKGFMPQSTYTYSFNYFAMNEDNTKFGSVFSQIYFRQAFQHLIDQPAWIANYLHGWAYPTSGPVPLYPTNPFSDSMEKSNPYAFSVSDASSLLSSHGWTVRPGGTTTCTDPGTGPNQCGPGVKAGTALSWNLDYEAGVPAVEHEMQQLQAVAKEVGIELQLTSHEFSTVVGTAGTPCAPSTPAGCTWTMENWGGGWVYAPDFEPTGEELFVPGAAANFQHYSDPEATKLILATTTVPQSQTTAAFDAYENYMVQTLPVIFGPTSFGNPIPGGPGLVSSKLGGLVSNAASYITPEAWYFTK